MKTRLEEMKNQAEAFHNKHPEVWVKFIEFTFDRINKGYKNYSVKAIFERIRWHTDIETNGEEFKMSNNYTPYYARFFMHEHPQYQGFFRTQILTEERE